MPTYGGTEKDVVGLKSLCLMRFLWSQGLPDHLIVQLHSTSQLAVSTSLGGSMSKVTQEEKGLDRSNQFERIAKRRAMPGVLSFTASRQLLYMNPEAEELCSQLLKADPARESGQEGLVPGEVYELCEALQQAPEAQTQTKETEGVQIRRVIGGDRFPMLIRGFLVPELSNDMEPQFLVLMEKMGRRSQVPTLEAKNHFHLTDREYEIVSYVAEGRTNKEIAEGLEISEHTVKEHIKHILRKTTATTRTGILAQILKYA